MCQSIELSTEEGMVGEQRECHSLPSQLERTTTTWLVMLTQSPPVAVSKQYLEDRNKNTLFLAMLQSA